MKYSIAILGLILSLSLTAQSEPADSRLEALMSSAELEQLKSDNPKEYNYLVYSLDHSWYITDFPIQKLDDIQGEFTDIKLSSTAKINIYALGLSIKEKNYQYFRINEGNKMLVIRSREHIIRKMELEKQ